MNQKQTHVTPLARRDGTPEEKRTIHVSHVGENWEVEDDKATLGQAESQAEAIELAAELAAEARADGIQVHASDGTVTKEIPVNPAADAKNRK